MTDPIRLALLDLTPGDGRVRPLRALLHAAGFVLLDRLDPSAQAVLVLAPEGVPVDAEAQLLTAAGRGTPVLLVGPSPGQLLADAAGLVLGRLLPDHAIRLRPGRDAGSVAARLAADELLLTDRWPLADKVADDVEQLLTASSAFTDHPVATWRPGTCVGTLTVGSAPSSYAAPSWQRLAVRLLRRVLGVDDPAPVRIGMLGYGAIGHEHAAAIGRTDGLELSAVCDGNPDRIDAARLLVPEIRSHSDGDALLGDDGIDLVIVSTPPNTHAAWVLRALKAGKSVVVEKPFCLTVEEADRQIAAAEDAGLTLAVYQNRRWDRDFVAVKAAVRSGRLGDVFHVETFVGGYDHPCNFWHSDADVSGGAVYDWGSHYLDWVLDLLPQPVEWVCATAHKRVWHDVTNADHTRVLLHFADGVEAEFTHSDLAAVRKPKFYLLGTRGGLVGEWQQERVLSRSPVGLVLEDRFAVSDAPAALTLHDGDGSRTELALPVAAVDPFHRELADALLCGLPMSVTPQASRRNVAVMQAATQSAADGGRPVRLPA